MTGPEAKALRESTGLDLHAWAALLGILPQSVRNVETGGVQAGKALERLWKLTAQSKKARRKQ